MVVLPGSGDQTEGQLKTVLSISHFEGDAGAAKAVRPSAGAARVLGRG